MFSIIIVTWNNYDQVGECVESILENSYHRKHEIIIFYNESVGAKSMSGVRGMGQIFNKENIGLSAGANRAAKYANRDFLCFIDDDMKVLPDWDKYLLEALIKTGSNWAASTVIEPIAPHYNISTKEWHDGKRPKYWYKNISNTPLLIPTEFWKKIGGYDEDFSNVGAELGLAKRAYDHGERDFIQTPYSLVLHKQSQSMKRLNNRGQMQRKRDLTFKTKYNMTRKEFIRLIGKGERYKNDPII